MQAYVGLVYDLVQKQVFFTGAQLETVLNNRLELDGVRPAPARVEWLNINLRLVWDLQHKLRSERVSATHSQFNASFDGIANAFEKGFNFAQHQRTSGSADRSSTHKEGHKIRGPGSINSGLRAHFPPVKNLRREARICTLRELSAAVRSSLQSAGFKSQMSLFISS